MALTPEDVVNKRFQPTKFREGYDQDEVDDFLDEVVVELRRLNQENEDLRQRLIASDSRINELQRSAGQSSAAAEPVSVAKEPEHKEPEHKEPEAEVVVESAPEPVAEEPEFVEATPEPEQPQAQQVEQEPVVSAPAAYSAPAAEPVDPNSTNNLLQLARRLHEEHVREGVEKRDALIAEGREQATRVVAESTEQATRVVAEGHDQATRVVQEAEAAHQLKLQEAEAAQKARLDEIETTTRAQLTTLETERQQLEQERQQLEGRVDELRNFEREYRQKLKGYIEGQLRELDSTDVQPSGSPAYATPSASPNYTGFAGSN